MDSQFWITNPNFAYTGPDITLYFKKKLVKLHFPRLQTLDHAVAMFNVLHPWTPPNTLEARGTPGMVQVGHGP